MGGYADKLQKKAAEVLGPEERLVAAIRTMPRGTTMGTAIGGLVGSTVAQRQAPRAQSDIGSDSFAARWPQGNSAVGLTDQRLILFNYTALGKPKDLVAEFPLGDVASVDLEKKKVTANAVHFVFTDGSAVEVECAKMEKTADFVNAFQEVKPGR